MATESCAGKKKEGEGVRRGGCGMATEERVRGQPLTEEGKGRGGEEARKGRREGGRKEERVTGRDERPHWLYVSKHP